MTKLHVLLLSQRASKSQPISDEVKVNDNASSKSAVDASQPDDFLSRQAQLQSEARLALAQVSTKEQIWSY
jgi:Schwannomin-interacting protein 1